MTEARKTPSTHAEWYIDHEGTRHFRLAIPRVDLTRADYDQLDLMLFRDVAENGGDDGHPIADQLLALERMVRGIERAKK